MNKTIVTLAALAAIVVSASCAPTIATTDEPNAQTSSTPAPMPSPEVVAEEEVPTPTPTPEDKVAKFGESFTYEDDLQLTLAKPTKLSLPDYYNSYDEAGIEGDKNSIVLAKFVLTMVNNTGASFDPSMATIAVFVGDDAEPLDAHCFESVTCGTDQTTLRAGRKVTMSWAYAIPKAKANLISIEASPSFEHDVAVFEGAFK